MRFSSTAVHVLDNQAVFGTVSNSRAMKCRREKKILKQICPSLCWITWIVFTLFLSFALHHMSWNLFLVSIFKVQCFILDLNLTTSGPPWLLCLPPVAARCCQMNRPWVCWRMARVQRQCSGYKCSSLSAALTPTSSSIATSRSATTPWGCASLWVNSCNTHSSN